MLTRRAALALRLGGSLFFFAAIALLVKPGNVADIFGFKSSAITSELAWTLRVMGATFLIPALLAPVVAAFSGERGLRQAASGMAFISIGIGTVVLFTPGRWDFGKLISVALAYFFALFYFYALRGRVRNR